MIAYCLYKKQKREFITIRELPFDDARVRTYHHDLNADRVATLLVAARELLRHYANEVQEQILEEDRIGVQNSTIVSELRGVGTNLTTVIKSETVWWKAIAYSAIGAFFVGVIIIFASRMGFMNPFDALDQPRQHQGKTELPAR